MKTSLLMFLSFATVSLLCAGKESPDSTKTVDLKEVVVEAQLQYTRPNVTIYIPDANSKRTAQNAIDLLNRMEIPQINVNPVSGTVETPSGEEVKIYIDMELASEAEKDALRAEDVKKVEYLVYPTDPRFNKAKYVLNITLRHSNYGGYAKLTGTYSFMSGKGNGLAYTKMSYNNMTYDISISDRYSDHHHNGTEQEQTFRLPQTDGSVKEITRFNQLDDSRFKENLFGLSFRAKYTAENMMLSNTLFFTTLNTPDNSNSGQLTFSPSMFSGNRYSNSFNSDNIYPRWVGAYYFKFDNGLSLNAIPSIHYTHTKSSRHYVSDQTSIITDAKENAITGQLAFQVNKEFSKHHSIDLNLIGIYYYNKVKYSGNTIASPEFNQFAYGGILGYSFTSESLCAKLNAGFAGESNKISGLRTNSLIPLMNLSAQYSFNRKNSINLSAQYNVNPVEASEKTPDVIQENELLYLTGNPYLKNTHWGKMSVDYTWLPNNRLSVNLSSGWSRYFNRPTPLFTPDGPNGTILRSVINDGDYQDLYVTASISAKLLKRRLVFRVAPIMWFEKTTGLYSEKNNYINLNLSGTYYLKNVYFSAYLSTASRMLIQYDMSATSSKSKSTYQFKFGWRKGNWNISAAAVNFFRKSYVSKVYNINSQWFDQTGTVYGISSHQHMTLSASYTFGFGKKVKRGDEIQTIDGSSSAIMK